MDYSQLTAVIAGATGGLGRVVTRLLGAAGMRLALLGRSEDRLQQLVDELGLPADQVLTAAVDLIHPEGLEEIAASIQEKFGRTDVVLHLVGGWIGGKTLLESPSEDFREMLDQHLWTTVNLVQAFLPNLQENGFGRVIVISSPTATQPKAKSGPYGVGKAAQEALIMTLAAELKNTGVTANVIQVHSIDTDHLRAADPVKYARWTTPEEIVEAIQYLISEEGGRLNGARLPLFG